MINDFHHFKYKSIGPQGVGADNQLIVDMSSYFDRSKFPEIDASIREGFAKLHNGWFVIGSLSGQMPPELREKIDHNHGMGLWQDFEEGRLDHRLWDDREKIKARIEKDAAGLDFKQFLKYIQLVLGGHPQWAWSITLKESPLSGPEAFATKNTDAAVNAPWRDYALKHFPKLVEFYDNDMQKIMKVGRVLIFVSFPNSTVLCHRDSVVVPHKDHNCNVFFGGRRPMYVYDEINKSYHYAPSDCISYVFNNRDYHGVDASPRLQYTVRCDGQFTPEICEKLKLKDNLIFDYSYVK